MYPSRYFCRSFVGILELALRGMVGLAGPEGWGRDSQLVSYRESVRESVCVRVSTVIWVL